MYRVDLAFRVDEVLADVPEEGRQESWRRCQGAGPPGRLAVVRRLGRGALVRVSVLGGVHRVPGRDRCVRRRLGRLSETEPPAWYARAHGVTATQPMADLGLAGCEL